MPEILAQGGRHARHYQECMEDPDAFAPMQRRIARLRIRQTCGARPLQATDWI
jgi:hypothetical protein